MIEINNPEMGQAPTSQARPRDIDHLPGTALKLGIEDSQLRGVYALQVWC